VGQQLLARLCCWLTAFLGARLPDSYRADHRIIDSLVYRKPFHLLVTDVTE
jgi:hypothetical protein